MSRLSPSWERAVRRSSSLPVVSLVIVPLVACPGKADDTGTPPVQDTDTGGVEETCTFYADADSDGFGDGARPVEGPCGDPPTGAAGSSDDCDDGRADVHPGATETCDGADQDCDGAVDDEAEDATRSWPDADGDGYGDVAAGEASCDVPSGRVTTGGDCDDTEPAVNPAGVDEGCDGLDNDCDGEVDGGWRVPEDQPNLQVAVSSAPAGGVVCVSPGTHDGPLDTRGKAVRVIGWAGAEVTFVRGVGGARVVTIANGEGASTVLEGLTILSGKDDEGAGIYLSGSSPTLTDLVVEGNTCVVAGTTGACKGTGIFSAGGSPSLTRVTVQANTQEAAQMWGAGIHVEGGSPTLQDVVIEENAQVDGADRSFFMGAGLSVWGGDVVTTDVTVRGNTQTYDRPGVSEANVMYGGGVYVQDADLTAVGLTVEGNAQTCVAGYTHQMYGAGVYAGTSAIDRYTVTVQDASLSANTMTSEATGGAQAYGAGLCALYARVELTDVDVAANEVDLTSASPIANGGGVMLAHDSAGFARVRVVGNRLRSGDGAQGGGIYLSEADLEARNTVLAGNALAVARGTLYGAGMFGRNGSVSFENCDVVENSCDAGTCHGAAFAFYTDVDVVFRSTSVVGHTSGTGSGRVVYSDFGDVSIDAGWSNFHDNGSSPWYGVTAPSAAAGNFDADPIYADVSAADPRDWDLRLGAGSACVDAGDPSVTDLDGSRADVGSWGGPLGGW